MGKFKGLENLVIEPTEAIALGNETALEERFELAGIVPQLIELAKIERSPFQPRQFFDPEKIAKMSESFRHYRAQGTYPKTAILVRPTRSGGYELIFGEQRKLAAQEAGYTDFLAFVDESITDEEALELALRENLLRQDLNSLEKTDAILKLAAVRLQSSPLDIKRLLDKAANDRKSSTDNVIRTESWLKLESFFQELPDRITPESFRTNYLPLLNLPDEILEVLRQGKLEYTKARAIAKVKNDLHRQQLLQEAIELKLSLEEIRSRIKAFASSNGKLLTTDDRLLPKRFISLAKQIQKTKAWADPKKAKQLQSLLEKLEKLL